MFWSLLEVLDLLEISRFSSFLEVSRMFLKSSRSFQILLEDSRHSRITLQWEFLECSPVFYKFLDPYWNLNFLKHQESLMVSG